MSNSSIVVAGIDPGSLVTGYAFLELISATRKIVYLTGGVVRTTKQKDLNEKILFIHQNISEIINKLNPDHAAIEDIFYHRNIHSAFVLGHVRGAVILTFGMHNIPIFSYSPALIKKVVTGYGRADKKPVYMMLKSLLGIKDEIPPDASDAIAVALAHCRKIAYDMLSGKKFD